jgi:hypothetical protein
MRDIGKGRAKLLTLEVGCRLLCAQVDGQEEEQGDEQAAPHLRRLHSVRVACLNRRRICVFAAESKRHSLCARAATAVPQLLCPGAAAFKWHFPQENATLDDPRKGT